VATETNDNTLKVWIDINVFFRLANAAPFDALLDRKSWNYFTLNSSVNSWCSRVKRPAASQIEGKLAA